MGKNIFSGPTTEFIDTIGDVGLFAAGAGAGKGGSGKPDSPGNSGGDHGNAGDHGNPGDHGNGGNHGSNDGGATDKGDLYGDQIVVLRDLDPTDGDGGNGEVELNPMILVGYDDPENPLDPDNPLGGEDGLFPIFVYPVDGEYEIPTWAEDYVQEVELERANVARAPEHVLEHALLEALTALGGADAITTDPAGRLMYSMDGGASFSTIDSPLENLALYTALMTANESHAWPDVTEGWGTITVEGGTYDLSFLENLDGWAPSALLAAAWGKEGAITLDALLYENTTLGINTVGEGGNVSYFAFSDAEGETYNYIRSEHYDDTWLRWIVTDENGNPVVDENGNPMFDYGTVFDAVFDGVEWGVNNNDGVLEANEDVYLAVNADGDDFVFVDAGMSGVNDFAQAADDSRAVIAFIHDGMAQVIDESDVPPEYLGA